MEPNHISIILTYFAFTTLSTVGFGDYVPRSDDERVVGSIIMLFGVMIFSTIMGGFIDLITEFKHYNKDLNDGYRLAKFFGVLYRFNGKKQIDENLKKRIEDHFDYQWEHNLNIAFATDKDLNIYNQMPEAVQQNLFTDYMFNHFLYNFQKLFSFPNRDSNKEYAFYTWHD